MNLPSLNNFQVHLLCLLAHGMLLNRTVCNDEELQAHALSYIPAEFVTRPRDKYNVHALLKLVQWFSDWLPIESDLQEAKSNPVRYCLVGISCVCIVSF